MEELRHRIIVAAIFVALAILAVANPAAAQCPPGEILVDEDATHWYCKTPRDYSACIGKAGRDSREEAGKVCGQQFHRCFTSNSINASLATSVCLATSLFGCGAGMAACAAACNTGFTALEWVAAESCGADVEPCYDDVLVHDRQRKQLCKR